MIFDVRSVTEQAARVRKPYLWEDFASKLSRLSIFTAEQAEESAEKKRIETLNDVGIVLPVIVRAVTDVFRNEAVRSMTPEQILALCDVIDGEAGVQR